MYENTVFNDWKKEVFHRWRLFFLQNINIIQILKADICAYCAVRQMQSLKDGIDPLYTAGQFTKDSKRRRGRMYSILLKIADSHSHAASDTAKKPGKPVYIFFR